MKTAPVFRIDPPLSGQENMSIDMELLRGAEANQKPYTAIRFYQWDKPTVSLGKHQTLRTAVDMVFCDRNGIPVVYRPTGGRAVLHDIELTYAVVSNELDRFPSSTTILGTYRQISESLDAGLKSLGIFATMERGPTAKDPNPGKTGLNPCFTSTSRFELAVDSRKIAGSAQRRLGRSFLQHGSVPIKINYTRMARALGVSESFLRRSMISVSEAAGRQVNFEELASALQEAFCEHLFDLAS